MAILPTGLVDFLLFGRNFIISLSFYSSRGRSSISPITGTERFHYSSHVAPAQDRITERAYHRFQGVLLALGKL